MIQSVLSINTDTSIPSHPDKRPKKEKDKKGKSTRQSNLLDPDDTRQLQNVRDAMARLPEDPFAAHDLSRKEWDDRPVSPTFGQFVVFCACIVAGVGFGATALIMVSISGLDALSSLAVYFD